MLQPNENVLFEDVNEKEIVIKAREAKRLRVIEEATRETKKQNSCNTQMKMS
ncbi:MAG: hypothetical protein AAB267_04700 [Candidatus Desantisbacteria bacterium]